MPKAKKNSVAKKVSTKRKKSGNPFVFDQVNRAQRGIGKAIAAKKEFNKPKWKKYRNLERVKAGILKTDADYDLYNKMIDAQYWKKLGKLPPI